MRDTAQVCVSLFGDRESMRSVALATDDAEVRIRAWEIYRSLTIRDLDRLASLGYPDASALPGWRAHEDDDYVSVLEYAGFEPAYNYWLANTPEFRWAKCVEKKVNEGEYGGTYAVPAEREEQSLQTRRQLIKYLVRTNDWAAARRILPGVR